MQPSITNPRVAGVLAALYADSATNDPVARQAASAAGTTVGDGDELARYRSEEHMVYMAVNRDLGHLLYTLVRGTRARTVVEFGTSFGVSTIYLAAAVQDNGEGRVITTDLNPAKAARAKTNLASAGLEAPVEFRVGDALETLATDLPDEIDLVFLDGAKSLYLPVLQLLEARLRPGALIASDNTNHDGMEPFLEYLRKPGNGYLSSAILTAGGPHGRGHEISIRL